MKIVMVTGASSGIGAEFVRQLDQSFSRIDEIWMIARNVTKMEEIASALKNKTRIIGLDLEKNEQRTELQMLIEKENPNICMLVNCAGFGLMGDFEKLDMEEQLNMVELNCKALTAVAEELGGIFAICLILVCLNCFLAFLKIAMDLDDTFYRLVASGLAVMYIFQIFLTIGGGIKFIPLTGVTLPLVSYGGSSVLTTLIVFAIMQGLYMLRFTEEKQQEKARIKEENAAKKRQEKLERKKAGAKVEDVEEDEEFVEW